jgi:hypothetical protein
MFNADSDIFIDIDENPLNPVTNNVNGACVTIEYPYSANATVTLGTHSNTASTIQSGSAGVNHIKKVWHYENGMSDHLLATLTVQANAGYILQAPFAIVEPDEGFEDSFYVGVQWFQGISGWYTTIRYSETTSSQSFSACDFNNKFNIGFTINPENTSTSNTVTNVALNGKIGAKGGEVPIKVLGDADTQYTISAQNTTSNDYYNWDGTYGSSVASEAGTIPASGIGAHLLTVPEASTSSDVDIIITSVGGATLGADVPTSAGGLKVSQHGTNTVDIALLTETSSNFGTLPSELSITRPIRYSGDTYETPKVNTITFRAKAPNASNKLAMSSKGSKLKSGMYISGNNIPNNTVIKQIKGDYVILNKNTEGAIDHSLKCFTKAGNVLPFSFTVLPNSSPNTLNVNSSNKHGGSVWGLQKKVVQQVDGNQLGASSLVVLDTNGIFPFMVVTGTGIPSNTTVNSVSYSTNTITLNQAHSGVIDEDDIAFGGKGNPNIAIEQLSVEKKSDNIIISGYLNVSKLDNTSKIYMFIDDMITVT